MPGRSMPADRETARKWHAVVGSVELLLPPSRFVYLRHSEVVQVGPGSLRIAVPSLFAGEWLNQCFGDDLAAAIERQWGRPMALEFVPPEHGAPDAALFQAAPPCPSPPVSLTPGLHPGHTFERYVVGDTNRAAHEAAMALANSDTWRPTPLVITGAPGVGKTHLLQALAWHALARDWPVVCLRWSDFIGQFVGSIRSERIEAFKTAVRGARMLIIDDLRDVSTAPKSAEELLNAIDAVEAGKGAVIVSAERRPAELGMPDRLVSRLKDGLCLEVVPFGQSERLAYARQFCGGTGIDIPEWTLERVAQWEADSVRSLRGALNGITMLARLGTLDGNNVDLELAKCALGAPGPETRVKTILALVAQHTGVPASELTGRGKSATVARARAKAAAALHRSGLSIAAVGTELGRPKGTAQGIVKHGEELLAADLPLAAALAG